MKNKIIPIILIVIFSLVLWGSVTLSEYYVETLKFPLEVVDQPKNYSSSYLSHKEVFIKFRARGSDLAKIILTGEHTFKISAHKRIGRFKVDLRNEIENNLWITSSLNIIEISPASVECEIDKTVKKVVPIKINVKINFAEGYDISSRILVEPAEIEISGPAIILQSISEIETDSITLDNVKEKTIAELSLKQINGIKFSTNKCRIEFDVQRIVERVFNDLFVEVINVPPKKQLNLYPDKISVILKGGINKLGRLPNDSIKVYVDYLMAVKSEENFIEPTVEIPNFTKLLDVKPQKLEFIIKEE